MCVDGRVSLRHVRHANERAKWSRFKHLPTGLRCWSFFSGVAIVAPWWYLGKSVWHVCTMVSICRCGSGPMKFDSILEKRGLKASLVIERKTRERDSKHQMSFSEEWVFIVNCNLTASRQCTSFYATEKNTLTKRDRQRECIQSVLKVHRQVLIELVLFNNAHI